MPATYTVKQVADILGYSTNSIYTFLKEGRIQSVRVGKGRFRIPQSELDRLLVMAKANEITDVVEIPQNPQTLPPVSNPVVPPAVPTVPIRYDTLTPQAVPGLFDWSIILGALIIGITGPLTGEFRVDSQVSQAYMFLPAFITCFVAGGLGYLLAKLGSAKPTLWQWLFGSILSGGFLVLGVVRFLHGDWTSGYLGVLMGVVFIVSQAFKVSGVTSFVVFVSLLLAGEAFAGMRSEANNVFRTAVVRLAIDPALAWAVLAMVCVLVAGGALISYFKHKRFFTAAIMVAGVFLVRAALWNGMNATWTKSFILLLYAVLCMLAPYWHSLPQEHRRDRKILIALFSIILSLFISSTLVVRIFSGSILEYARTNLGNTASYSAKLVGDTIAKNTTSIEAFSHVSIFVNALRERDTQAVEQFLHSAYETTPGLMRLVAYGAEGDVIAQYPLTNTVTVPTITSAALLSILTGKNVQISETLEASYVPPRTTVSIAAPVLSDATVSGMLEARLSMTALEQELQEFVSKGKDEQVIVIDTSGRIVMHPDPTLLGTSAGEELLVWRGARGEQGIGEEYDAKNRLRSLVAYDTIQPLGWGVSVGVPIGNELQSVSGATLVIFSLVVMQGVVVGTFLWGRKIKYHIPSEIEQDSP